MVTFPDTFSTQTSHSTTGTTSESKDSPATAKLLAIIEQAMQSDPAQLTNTIIQVNANMHSEPELFIYTSLGDPTSVKVFRPGPPPRKDS